MSGRRRVLITLVVVDEYEGQSLNRKNPCINPLTLSSTRTIPDRIISVSAANELSSEVEHPPNERELGLHSHWQ